MTKMSSSKQTIDTATSPTDGLATHYALHVALQTMKERCQSLQQRLALMEDENSTLRLKAGVDHPILENGEKQNGQNEVDQLTEKVAELTRQKFQLTEHIAMVATENRQLWSRLSKLTKDNQNLGNSLSKMKDSINEAATNNQNLIRSKTFTQNSPNPILRQRMSAAASGTAATIASQKSDGENLSLEEISLKVLNEFLEGKAEIEKKCTEIMTPTTAINNSFGFGYLNDEPIGGASDADIQNDIKKCSDGMVDIKRELLRQQSDIKVALSSLRQRRILELCPSCKSDPRKPITADKKLETDDIITSRYDDDKSLVGHKSTTVPIISNSVTTPATAATTINMKTVEPIIHIDFLEQKRKADAVDKMCPMCAKVYTSATTFDDFQDHVESHFIDDSELDVSIEKNFEFVSHAVGNF